MYKLWRTSITRDNPSVSIPVGRNSSQSTCSETDSRKTHEFGAIGEELECSSMRSSINSESQPVVVGLPGLLKSDAESLQQPAIQNPDDLVINFWNSEPKFKAEYEVPSSDHAAEIIGKKGKKILRTQQATQTKITSPKLGERPVFIVEGERLAVQKALNMISMQCTYFESIRSTKSEQSLVGKIFVPKNLVGLVVGESGRTIQRIQRNSSTVIKTPKAEEDPVFVITSDNESLEKAVSTMLHAVHLINEHIREKTYKNEPMIYLHHLFTLLTPIGSKLINYDQICQPFDKLSLVSAEQSAHRMHSIFSEYKYSSSWLDIF